MSTRKPIKIIRTIERLEQLQQEVEWLINNTPTGQLRNDLTDINIMFIKAIENQKNK